MILLLGGNSDGIRISEKLKEKGIEFIYSSLHEYGSSGSALRDISGALTREKLKKLAEDREIEIIIDATHPYAKIISENAMEVAGELGISYLRFERDKAAEEDLLKFKTEEEVIAYLSERPGKILLTTGSSSLRAFSELGSDRLIARVLPTSESVKICEMAGLGYRQIIAESGPFSVEENLCSIRKYKPEYILMKDSGRVGGTAEKIAAAKKAGITPIVIERPEISYPSKYSDMEELLLEVERELNCN